MESKRKPAEKRRLHHLYQAAGGEGIVVDAVVETDVPEVDEQRKARIHLVSAEALLVTGIPLVAEEAVPAVRAAPMDEILATGVRTAPADPTSAFWASGVSAPLSILLSSIEDTL